MKLLVLLCSLLFSAQIFACSCSYDYGNYSGETMRRISKLIGLDDAKALQITDFNITTTAMAAVDPATYAQCGCTAFVKLKWSLAYNKDDKACTALAVKNEWNNKMKVKDIDCR